MTLAGRTIVVAFLAHCLASVLEGQSPQYQVRDSIIVGHVGGDFFSIDPTHRRLYGAGPNVVDIDQNRVIGMLADTNVGGGFVLAPALGRGMVRNGIVFELQSGATVKRLAASGDAALYEPVTAHAFLLGDSVAVVDLKRASLVAKIRIPGAGESGVADGRGRVYLNLVDKNAIAVVDATTLKVVNEYSVGSSTHPMGLAIDRAHNRLFAACTGRVVVVDAGTGRIVATIPVPGQSDQNAFDPATGLLFEPGGSAGMAIIHEDSPDRYSIVQTVNDPRVTGVAVVVDPRSRVVYMPYVMAGGQFGYLMLAPSTPGHE